DQPSIGPDSNPLNGLRSRVAHELAQPWLLAASTYPAVVYFPSPAIPPRISSASQLLGLQAESEVGEVGSTTNPTTAAHGRGGIHDTRTDSCGDARPFRIRLDRDGKRAGARRFPAETGRRDTP